MQTLGTTNKGGWLSWFLRGVLFLGFIILVGRLGELQIIKGEYYKNLSEGNRVRRVPLPAPRGQILARGGEVLVGNTKVMSRVKYDPARGYELTDDLAEASDDEIIIDWSRDYKLGDAAAHVTGYLGAVSEKEVGKVDPLCPDKGPRKAYSLVGRMGLEEKYNCLLSGVDGEELIEVDTVGRKVRTIGRRDPLPGADIRVAIDAGLQETAYKSLEGRKGAVVITTPRGEVIALVSSPSFDPNEFSRRPDANKVAEIFENKDLPLFNRAIGGLYHPGSVFKPVVSIAALEEGKISRDFIYHDTGIITVNDFSYTNWYLTQYGGVEGDIELTRALARSTDTFFYKVGEFLGPNKLAEWSSKFGFGKKTGIDIPGEVFGLVPSPEWKREVKKENWFLGNTYHYAIGQGDLAVTPLEVNMAIASLASGGWYCTPTLVIGEAKTHCNDLHISAANINLVELGMKKACEEGGTGFTFFDFEPQVACKTGTAETDEEGANHAWFTLYGPVAEGYETELVITVLVEKAGEGSREAGPVARKIMDFWKSRLP